MRSTCNQVDMNEWLERDLHPTQAIMCWIWSGKISCYKCWKTVQWQSIYNVTAWNIVRNNTLTSDEFRIIMSNLHLNCAEYGLQTRFNPPQTVRVLPLDFQYIYVKIVNITHCKWWNSCIGFRHTINLFVMWV